MIEGKLKKTVKAFTDIVESIEALEIVEREGISKLKAKLRLFDGSLYTLGPGSVGSRDNGGLQLLLAKTR
jgi:hypothetical protein